jgi:hypothetical protein
VSVREKSDSSVKKKPGIHRPSTSHVRKIRENRNTTPSLLTMVLTSAPRPAGPSGPPGTTPSVIALLTPTALICKIRSRPAYYPCPDPQDPSVLPGTATYGVASSSSRRLAGRGRASIRAGNGRGGRSRVAVGLV